MLAALEEKKTSRRLIEGGFKLQTFPTIAAHVEGKKPMWIFEGGQGRLSSWQ
jgi:hypothetical protein